VESTVQFNRITPPQNYDSMIFNEKTMKPKKCLNFIPLSFFCQLACDLLVGLYHEGLYRVAGFHDDIERIRTAFDLGE